MYLHDPSDMMNGPVTERGYMRAQALVGSAKAALDRAISELRNDRGGENSVGADKLMDQSQQRTAVEDARRAWLFFNSQQASVSKVVLPKKVSVVQVGLQVTIRYLDDFSRHVRGEEETFIVGGKNESDTDSIMRTYSCLSPLCRAIIPERVGDQLTVQLLCGDEYRVKIMDLVIPDWHAIRLLQAA